MRDIAVGTRVVAVSHAEGDNLYVFGRGTYHGYLMPPTVNVEQEVNKIIEEYNKTRTFMPDLPEVFSPEQAHTALLLAEAVPTITLTEGVNVGQIVYGGECWWGDEATFAERAAKYTLHDFELKDARSAVESSFVELLASLAGAGRGGDIL